MRHYFVPSTHAENEYFTFNEVFNGAKFTFTSCPDVFSKNQLDYGSLAYSINDIEKIGDVL